MGKLRVGDSEIDLTLAVGPSSGSSPVQEVTTFGSVTIQYDLKLGATVQFVVRGGSPEAGHIDELATDVWLQGDILGRFRSWAVWQEWFHNGQDNVSCLAVDYKRLLNRRHVVDPAGLSFTTTDLGLIVWGMWQHTQAQTGGNLGVTLGTPNLTGVVRTRSYVQGDNLGQQAENESEEGIHWGVDHNLVYTARLLDSIPFLEQPLQLGVNVREMLRSSGGDFANAVFGDASKDSTTGVWAVDPNVATDPRGRWELAKGWPTVKLQNTLNEYTNAALAELATPVAHWNVEMEPERWITDSRIMPGDHAVLVVPRTLAAPIGAPTERIAVQVQQVSVSFDADGKLEVKGVVNERPNIPLPS